VLIWVLFSVALLFSKHLSTKEFGYLLLAAIAALGVSFLLTIPSWLILTWAVRRVMRLDWDEWNKRILIWGIGTLLTLLPFAILGYDEPSNILSFFGIHWMIISFGVFLYTFPSVQENQDLVSD
jgi:hypothetical protein